MLHFIFINLFQEIINKRIKCRQNPLDNGRHIVNKLHAPEVFVKQILEEITNLSREIKNG